MDKSHTCIWLPKGFHVTVTFTIPKKPPSNPSQEEGQQWGIDTPIVRVTAKAELTGTTVTHWFLLQHLKERPVMEIEPISWQERGGSKPEYPEIQRYERPTNDQL